MSKAQDATEAAIFAALNAGSLSWPVYQHVPKDTPPPVNIIGDMDGESFGTLQVDEDETIDVSILTVFQGEARKPVLIEQGRIRTALDGKSLSRDGFVIRPIWTASGAELMPDGETYLGTSRFTVLAFKS